MVPRLVVSGELFKPAPGVGFTALDWAARKGRHEIAEFLATDPRTRALVTMGAPVGWACYTNHVELAKVRRLSTKYICDNIANGKFR